jgi:hypothetical protein
MGSEFLGRIGYIIANPDHPRQIATLTSGPRRERRGGVDSPV